MRKVKQNPAGPVLGIGKSIVEKAAVSTVGEVHSRNLVQRFTNRIPGLQGFLCANYGGIRGLCCIIQGNEKLATNG